MLPSILHKKNPTLFSFYSISDSSSTSSCGIVCLQTDLDKLNVVPVYIQKRIGVVAKSIRNIVPSNLAVLKACKTSITTHQTTIDDKPYCIFLFPRRSTQFFGNATKFDEASHSEPKFEQLPNSTYTLEK